MTQKHNPIQIMATETLTAAKYVGAGAAYIFHLFKNICRAHQIPSCSHEMKRIFSSFFIEIHFIKTYAYPSKSISSLYLQLRQLIITCH